MQKQVEPEVPSFLDSKAPSILEDPVLATKEKQRPSTIIAPSQKERFDRYLDQGFTEKLVKIMGRAKKAALHENKE